MRKANENTNKALETIRDKKNVLYYLEILLQRLECEENDILTEWGVIGKSEKQAIDWKTKELKWEDEEKTIPVYEDEYGSVPKKELDEDDNSRKRAIEFLKEYLMKAV